MDAMDDEPDEESLFNILIATDIHLGYNERHQIRANDSFVTFEEILNYGKTLEADLILLGGDLFHENKPTRVAIQRCMDLLRKYCLGPPSSAASANPVQFLSDPAVNFRDCATPTVNFEDPNLRVSLPIFSIHGNHDDPCGEGNYSVMDMLATSGFVNYFGKVQNFDVLKFQPILLRKGDSLIAVYGIGSMNDDRLFRLFEEEKVNFEVPAEFEDEWFNILVLHQNRARHGPKNYAAEHMLPDFVDLVFWGHEHECRIDPEDSDGRFFVTQPGSSIATSMCPGEAVTKHIGLLKVFRKQFTIERLPLKTVRPMVCETMTLSELESVGEELNYDEILVALKGRVDDMLARAQMQLTGHPEQPLLPLLRLKVECDIDVENLSYRKLQVKLGLENLIGNPGDVLKFVRKRGSVEKKEEKDANEGQDVWDTVFDAQPVDISEGRLESLLVEFLQDKQRVPLQVLHECSLAEGVKYYVEKDHAQAFEDLILFQAKSTMDAVGDVTGHDELLDAFEKLRDQRNKDPQSIIDEAHRWLSGDLKKPQPLLPEWEPVWQPPVDSVEVAAVSPAAARGTRGRGRGRAAAKTTAGRGRAKVVDDEVVIDDVEDEDAAESLKAAPKATRGRPRKTPSETSSIATAFAKQTTRATQRATLTPASSSRAKKGVQYLDEDESD